MAQTLVINGVDFSAYIQQTVDVKETPVYVDGPAEGISVSGNPFFDRVGTRYRSSFALKPLPREKFNALRVACEANEVNVYMTTSRNDDPISVVAQCSLSQYSYATDHAGQRIYTGATITIEAKSDDY